MNAAHSTISRTGAPSPRTNRSGESPATAQPQIPSAAIPASSSRNRNPAFNAAMARISPRTLRHQRPGGGDNDVRRSSGTDVEPGDVGLAPEPGPLALRERLVAAGVLGDGSLTRQLAVEDGPGLAVAD